jgi:hypothetical protein
MDPGGRDETVPMHPAKRVDHAVIVDARVEEGLDQM